MQRFIYDFRILKRDYANKEGGVFEDLSSSNAFEEAIALVNETEPPDHLGGLIAATSDQVTRSTK